MTKKQKIIMSILLALFVIPEVLWSSLSNDLYAFFMPLSDGRSQYFRQGLANIDTISKVLFVEFLGVFLSFIYLIYIRKSIQSRKWFWFFVVLLGALSLITFFDYGLSKNLRNIGF